ncbi:ferritin [Alistipes sp.]|uniref:ferritin n=1 Tax=Alistipes sp. TaxID=1872444 RepID=UPI003A8499CB
MISKNMQEALNAQINAELWSAYLYLSMSMDADDKGLKGSAHWFAHQFKEEQEHARKLAGYLQSQNAKVVLAPIATVQTEWPSVTAMFEDTLAHEQKVTAMIHELCKLAAAEQDFATANMLQWFVNEQVEEEDAAREIVDAFRMVEGEKVGVYMLDQKLGAR